MSRKLAATSAVSPAVRQATPRTLSVDAVVTAALQIAEADGLSGVTLGRVARKLGCHVTSLYTHVDSIDDLHVRMAVVVQSELAQLLWRAALGAEREGALRRLAVVYRDFGESSPVRSRLLFALTTTKDPRFRTGGQYLAEPIRATLGSFGLDDEQVRHAHRAFGSAMRGFLLAQAEGQYSDDADDTFEAIVSLFTAALTAGNWPGGSG